ncbi:hypothetical protein BKA66DRAFT_453674 [Pyrenochaeta sp. MPI-SDFR-AT-0127]|nr:hypothetical protein BKA66DRAFT_453674 [Pyrenochaeta sp. MPI-SDFR-AT-0127]
MSSQGLNVRWLASTRVSEHTGQELGQNDQNEEEVQAGSDEIEKDSIGLKDCEKSPRLDDEAAEKGYHNEIDPTTPPSPSSASDTEYSSDETSSTESTPHRELQGTSCIQEAQLSQDGTCIFTSDYSRTFSVYPIGTNILSNASTSAIKPYAQFTSPNPIWAFAANPLFNLQDAASTHVLVSRRDSYITLHNALWDITRNYDSQDAQTLSSGPVDIAKPLASYKLIDHLTEAVTAPISLAYAHDGAHFFAGKQNGIATFDLEHTNDPIHTITTIPSKRNKLKGGGRGFKGWISALSLSLPSTTSTGGLLAAGSRTRYIGIYDSTSGGDVTHFSLPGTIDGKKARNENLRHIMGDGVSHLKWSFCGKYLYVAERHSDVLLIYDVRNFSLSLGYCVGRKAETKQKLGFDIWNAGPSPYDIEAMAHEVWAGGSDGHVRIWKDPYRKEGPVLPDEVVQIQYGKLPVVSTLVHSSGCLAVAACGVVDVGDEKYTQGRRRGGGVRPRYREYGSLDILGLG